jgi:hypothetical protein
MVTGATAGLGKTSVAHGVAARFAAANHQVEVFEEADILERAEFADVMSTFRSGEAATLDQLLVAAGRYAYTCRRSPATVFVQDMLFPYLPSLLAWGYADEEIEDFLSALHDRLRGFTVVQVHLRGDASTAIKRAAAREGGPWLDWMIAKVAGYADLDFPVDDLVGAVRYFEDAERRTLRLLESAPWIVHVVDADAGEAGALQAAMEALALD